MTKDQAFEILGMDEKDLLGSDSIQELLTKHNDQQKRYSTIINDKMNGGRSVKVQNFQALIDTKYTCISDLAQARGKEGIAETDAMKDTEFEFVNLRLKGNQMPQNHMIKGQSASS